MADPFSLNDGDFALRIGCSADADAAQRAVRANPAKDLMPGNIADLVVIPVPSELPDPDTAVLALKGLWLSELFFEEEEPAVLVSC